VLCRVVGYLLSLMYEILLKGLSNVTVTSLCYLFISKVGFLLLKISIFHCVKYKKNCAVSLVILVLKVLKNTDHK